MTTERDPMRWVWRGIMGATLLFGWIFILWQNKFHVDVPVVIVCLAFFAVVATITNLWRVGATVVAPEHAGEEAWSRPLGARAELEKEKKTLLKQIKEAEFDQAMGKLSKHDGEELIRMYRTRAIELIKELDRLDAGQAETPRQRIERELAARVAIEQEKEKARAVSKKKGKKPDGKSTDAKPEANATSRDASAEAKATAEDAKTAPDDLTPEPTVESEPEPKTTEASS